MAVTAAVVTGYLPTADSSSTDFTASGFGTPDAAIVITSDVISGTNPYPFAQHGVGFWTSANQAALGIASEDAAATSNTASDIRSGACVTIPVAVATSQNIVASGASITDGLRITKNSGTTSLSRFCVVILLKGLTNAYVGQTSLPSTGTSLSITAPGFKPDLMFGAGSMGSIAGLEAQARMSFGVAHNNSLDAISQAVVAFGDLDAQSAAQVVNTTIRNDRWLQQAINNSDAAYAAVSSFDAIGFSLSYNSNGFARQYAYLAVELPDPDDAYVAVVDSKTSTGTQAYTGTGFTPVFVGLIGTTLTAVNSLATSAVGSISMGVASGTGAQKSISFGSEDAAGTSSTYSRADESNILDLRFQDDAADALASLQSFDSDGWTLNFSDGSASARKILAFAIGDSAGAPSLPTLSALTTKPGTLTSTGFTPRVTAS